MNFQNFISITLLLAVINAEAHLICPLGFDMTYNKIESSYICYRLKEQETFQDKFKNCNGNVYTLELYQKLNITKTKSKLWTDFTTLYPGGPFIDWKYGEEEPEILFDISNKSTLDNSKDLCLIKDNEDYVAVDCEEKHDRYCFVTPYSDKSDWENCEEFQSSFKFYNPEEICLMNISIHPGLSFVQAKDMCQSKNGNLLSKGWTYANLPQFNHLSVYPVDKQANDGEEPHVDISENSVGRIWEENNTRLWALQNGVPQLVEKNYVFTDILCERSLNYDIILELSVNLKNQIVLSIADHLDENDINCFTDSVTYHPTKIQINYVIDHKIYVLSPVDDGFYWCVHVHPKTKIKSLSNRVLFTNEDHRFWNLYAVKMHVEEYVKENLDVLKFYWKQKLAEYIFDNTKKHLNFDDNLVITENSKNLNVNFKSDEIVKSFKIKKLYLDKTTILVHIELNNDMIPYNSGEWDDIEVVYMRPVYIIGKFEDNQKCTGNFNEGILCEIETTKNVSEVELFEDFSDNMIQEQMMKSDKTTYIMVESCTNCEQNFIYTIEIVDPTTPTTIAPVTQASPLYDILNLNLFFRITDRTKKSEIITTPLVLEEQSIEYSCTKSLYHEIQDLITTTEPINLTLARSEEFDPTTTENIATEISTTETNIATESSTTNIYTTETTITTENSATEISTTETNIAIENSTTDISITETTTTTENSTTEISTTETDITIENSTTEISTTETTITTENSSLEISTPETDITIENSTTEISTTETNITTDNTSEISTTETTLTTKNSTTEISTTETNITTENSTTEISTTETTITTENNTIYTTTETTDTLTSSTLTPPQFQPQEIVEQILEDLEQLLQNETTPIFIEDIAETFDQINSLLDQNQDVVFPGELLQLLEQLSKRVDLNGAPTATLVGANIAMLLADSGPENPILGISVAARETEEFNEESFAFYNEFQDQLAANITEAAVFLPPSLTAFDRRISFIVFRNDQAFNDSRGMYAINSRIISVNVANFTGFGYGEVVNIHTRPQIVSDRNTTRSCAYWRFLDDGSGYWSQDGCTFVRSEDPEALDICQCDHLTHFAEILIPRPVFSQIHENILEFLSIIGCSISISGLLVIIMTSILFKSWRRSFRNQMWLQLCISLFVMMICFLSVVFVEFENYNVSCMLIGIALHYSLLASFCWMLVVAIKSYRDLVLIFAKPVTHKLLVASSCSWGLPVIFIGILLIADPLSYVKRFSDMNPSSDFCYPSGLGLWISVYAPVAAMLFVNIVLFLLIVRNIGVSPKNLRYQRAGDKREALNCARIGLVLVFFFGLPWFFGLFANNIIAAYLFTCTATLQGFVLFVFIVLRNFETRNLWLLKLRPRKLKNKPYSGSVSMLF